MWGADDELLEEELGEDELLDEELGEDELLDEELGEDELLDEDGMMLWLSGIAIKQAIFRLQL